MSLSVKQIHLLHVLKILPGETIGFGQSIFQILTEIFIKSGAVFVFSVTSNNVTPNRPIEA